MRFPKITTKISISFNEMNKSNSFNKARVSNDERTLASDLYQKSFKSKEIRDRNPYKIRVFTSCDDDLPNLKSKDDSEGAGSDLCLILVMKREVEITRARVGL